MMGIGIKHDEYERLIRELAASRRTSITDAIGMAVRNELERDRTTGDAKSFMERLKRAQAIIAASPILDPRTPDEIVGYDEHGLPT